MCGQTREEAARVSLLPAVQGTKHDPLPRCPMLHGSGSDVGKHPHAVTRERDASTSSSARNHPSQAEG